MIIVEIYNRDKIVIHGHSYPDICAACSSIMYTTANFIDKYDCMAEDFTDDTINDVVTITIKKHDNVIDTAIDNMIDMLNDLCEDNPLCIKIKSMGL